MVKQSNDEEKFLRFVKKRGHIYRKHGIYGIKSIHFLTT